MTGPARVFISYSSKDAALVTRLKDDLARAGVDVWLDHERLAPGTPNWQAAVRAGIAQATTIIYSASPDTADSEYVGHELAIARDGGKTILPFWVRGEQWSRCTPMGYYYAQHVDGRDAAYAVGLAALLAALGAVSTTQPAVPIPAREATERAQAVARLIATQAAAARVAPQSAPALRSYPLPDVPARLASLGFRGVNPNGTPAILPPLVSVAAGPFLMGSADSDWQADDGEKPQHRVELAAFQIGKYPMTVAEYALAVRAGAVSVPPASGNITWAMHLLYVDYPVVCVSWQDATAYVAWLRGVTGEAGWRLPSEAQWEKAARWDAARGVSRTYPWGNTFNQARCNTRESDIRGTTRIGSYPANGTRRSGASPWGAEDMAGNVWEWTSSLYKPYPYTEDDGREDQDSTENRTIRGGSWYTVASGARAAYRNSGRLVDRVNFRGFRLAFAPLRAGS